MLEEGNIRIYITESCNAKCPNCFNRTNRSDNSMDIDVFEKICIYFQNNGITNIKIMGGEPTIHPDFRQITKIAQRHFKTVSIFTNAINDGILNFSPRDTDSVIYNFKFAKILNREKLLLDSDGRRSLEIQISSTTNIHKLKEDISRIIEICGGTDVLNPCLTLDCTENIFEYRQTIVDKYEDIWKFCKDMGFSMGQDHLIPFCFIRDTNIPMPKGGAICRLSCAGLIDSSYNIKFCNQFSDVSMPLFEDGNFIPFEKYTSFLNRQYAMLTSLSANKGCSTCSMREIMCNGGCFASKDFILAKDLCKYKIE